MVEVDAVIGCTCLRVPGDDVQPRLRTVGSRQRAGNVDDLLHQVLSAGQTFRTLITDRRGREYNDTRQIFSSQVAGGQLAACVEVLGSALPTRAHQSLAELRRQVVGVCGADQQPLPGIGARSRRCWTLLPLDCHQPVR